MVIIAHDERQSVDDGLLIQDSIASNVAVENFGNLSDNELNDKGMVVADRRFQQNYSSFCYKNSFSNQFGHEPSILRHLLIAVC